MDIFKILNLDKTFDVKLLNVNLIFPDYTINAHRIDYSQLFGVPIMNYLKQNEKEIKHSLKIARRMQLYEINSTTNVSFVYTAENDDYSYQEFIKLSDKAISKLIPQEIKDKIIADAHDVFMNELLTSYGKIKYFDVLIFRAIYGEKDMDKIYAELYTSVESTIDNAAITTSPFYYDTILDYYKLTKDSKYLELRDKAHAKAIEYFTNKFMSYNINRGRKINYYSIANTFVEYFNFLKIYSMYSLDKLDTLDNNVTQNQNANAKITDYINDDNYALLINFIESFKKSRRRLFEVLLEVVAESYPKEDREEVLKGLQKYKVFNSILLKNLAT